MIGIVAAPEQLTAAMQDRFDINRQTFHHGELAARYWAHPYGIHQDNQPLRYSQDFGYDREEMLRDLNPDVQPLPHMETAQRDLGVFIAREIIRNGEIADLNPADIVIGLFAAGVHDIGECTHPKLLETCAAVVGDIPRGKKTDAHRAVEYRILQTVFTERYADLPDAFLERALTIISHKEDTLIHTLTELSHDFGSYATAYCAGSIALEMLYKGDSESLRFQRLSSLGKQVSARARQSILDKAADFPGIEPSIERTNTLYNQIQTQL